MLTPNDESYKMKAHRVMVYALISTVASFASGLWVGALFLKHNDVFIFMVIGMVAVTLSTGWRARSDFKKLVSSITVAS